MTRRGITLLAGLAGVGLLVPLGLWAQDQGEDPMAAWAALAEVGEHHRRLDPLVGTFDAQSSFWMDPSAPPQTGTGVSVNTWTLGGRYVEQHYFGHGPEPFEGRGFTGYENATSRYVSSWMDTMGTGILTSTGEVDSTGRRLTFRGQAAGPGGVQVGHRYTLVIEGPNRHVFTLYQSFAGSPEAKAMEIVYTRR